MFFDDCVYIQRGMFSVFQKIRYRGKARTEKPELFKFDDSAFVLGDEWKKERNAAVERGSSTSMSTANHLSFFAHIAKESERD